MDKGGGGDQSEVKKLILTYIHEGIAVDHNFDNVAELAHASLTLVRTVAESLKKTPAAHAIYVQAIAEAAREGGVTEEQAQ